MVFKKKYILSGLVLLALFASISIFINRYFEDSTTSMFMDKSIPIDTTIKNTEYSANNNSEGLHNYTISEFEKIEKILQSEFSPNIYISKFRGYGGPNPSSVLYFYYYENGEMIALRAILRSTELIKTYFPDMESIVFHVSKGKTIGNGIETIGGLGLLRVKLEKLSDLKEINNLTDNEVKQAIINRFEVNEYEFDMSVLR